MILLGVSQTLLLEFLVLSFGSHTWFLDFGNATNLADINKWDVCQYTSVYSVILLPYGHSLYHFYFTHILLSLSIFLATFRLPSFS